MSRHRGLATRKEQDRLNEVMGEIVKIVGHHISADFFGTSWRVWIQTWHHHRRATTSDVCGHGETLLDAAERTLDILRNDPTVREGRCREGCPKWDPCLY